MNLNESIVEDAAFEWFLLRSLLRRAYGGHEGYGEQVGDSPAPMLRWTGLGDAVGHGPHLAPGEPAAERALFSEVVQSR